MSNLKLTRLTSFHCPGFKIANQTNNPENPSHHAPPKARSPIDPYQSTPGISPQAQEESHGLKEGRGSKPGFVQQALSCRLEVPRIQGQGPEAAGQNVGTRMIACLPDAIAAANKRPAGDSACAAPSPALSTCRLQIALHAWATRNQRS